MGKQRFGTNSFNDRPPSQDYFDALANYGGEWVRLSWTKWDSASQGAFLINDPANYEGLVKEDLAVLDAVVERAGRSGLKVVLTPLTLPGSVWSQHNKDRIDDRIYSDQKYWRQSAEFWKDLAGRFKNNPTVIAYNVLNEPSPERPSGFEINSPSVNRDWYQKQIGTARDLPGFYNFIIDEIRKIDSQTPIMVDGGFFANPAGFSYFPKSLDDKNVLYAFHMYEPWAATSMWNIRNGSKLTYPGTMKIWGRETEWNSDRVERTMMQPLEWAAEHDIEPSQIVMAEFGCVRYLTWCQTYLEDILSVADQYKMHWAFYTFRSDSWGGMDYELGSERPNPQTHGVTAEEFWTLSEAHQLSDIRRNNSKIFQPISRRLKANLSVIKP